MLFTSWMFWVTLISLAFAIIDRTFYYHSEVFFSIAVYVGPFILALFVAFLTAAVLSIIKLIRQLIQRPKTAAFNWLPVIILLFQTCVVFYANAIPVPDYYRIHADELNQLVHYVEDKVKAEDPSEKSMTIKVPQRLTGLTDRQVIAAKEDGILKIKVKLTGSAIGENSFLLYRADGRNPSHEDLPNTPKHKSTFERKSDKWFLVNWND